MFKMYTKINGKPARNDLTVEVESVGEITDALYQALQYDRDSLASVEHNYPELKGLGPIYDATMAQLKLTSFLADHLDNGEPVSTWSKTIGTVTYVVVSF